MDAAALTFSTLSIIQMLIQVKSTIGEAGDSINDLIDAMMGTDMLMDGVKADLPNIIRNMRPVQIETLRRLINASGVIIAQMRKRTMGLLAHVNAEKLKAKRKLEEEKEQRRAKKDERDEENDSEEEAKMLSFDIWARVKALWHAHDIETLQKRLAERVAIIMQLCRYYELHSNDGRPTETIPFVYEVSKQLGNLEQFVPNGKKNDAQEASTSRKTKSERMFDLLFSMRSSDSKNKVRILDQEEQAALREHVHGVLRSVSARRQVLESRQLAQHTSREGEAAVDYQQSRQMPSSPIWLADRSREVFPEIPSSGKGLSPVAQGKLPETRQSERIPSGCSDPADTSTKPIATTYINFSRPFRQPVECMTYLSGSSSQSMSEQPTKLKIDLITMEEVEQADEDDLEITEELLNRLQRPSSMFPESYL